MHVFDSLGIVFEKTEIVHRISVNGVAVNLFMVIEDAVAPKGTRADNVAIC